MFTKIKYTAVALIVFIMAWGCDEILDDNGDGNGDANVAEAQAVVDSARTALETELFDLITAINAGTLDSLDQINFTGSNALYRKAVVLDSNNVEANFGAGLTEFMIFTQDPSVKEVFDEWEMFIDTASIFVKDDITPTAASMLSLIFGQGGASQIQPMGEEQVGEVYITMFKMAVSNPPLLSDIQGLLEASFIPLLDYAIARFEVVDDSTDFTFTVTPRMQGDELESAVEMDLTEVYMMETVMNMLNAFARMAVAYNVGPGGYSEADIAPFFRQGSGFLSLRTNGAANLALAKQHLLTGSAKLDAAIAFLKAETDDQSDDLLTMYPDGPTTTELNDVLAGNVDFRDALTTGVTITEDWNDNGTETEQIFNIGNIFDNPITDFKSILPAYTVRTQVDTSYDWTWGMVNQNRTITLPFDLPVGYYRFRLDYFYDDWDDRLDVYADSLYWPPGADSILFSLPGAKWIADSLHAAFASSDSTYRWWSIHVGFDMYLDTPTNQIQIWINYDYEVGTPDWTYYSAVITFDANSYAEWDFQINNMNGLLQGITTSDQFKTAFGFSERDFKKEEVLHLEFGGADYYKQMPIPSRDFQKAMIPWAFIK